MAIEALVGAGHQRSACADELQRSTTEWAHAKLQIPRALPSAASDPRCNTYCGSSVDGTVAVNTAFHQFFRRVAFLTRLRLRRALTYRKIDAHWRCGPVPNDKPLPVKERIACNFLPAKGSRPVSSTRRGGGVCRSVALMFAHGFRLRCWRGSCPAPNRRNSGDPRGRPRAPTLSNKITGTGGP